MGSQGLPFISQVSSHMSMQPMLLKLVFHTNTTMIVLRVRSVLQKSKGMDGEKETHVGKGGGRVPWLILALQSMDGGPW